MELGKMNFGKMMCGFCKVEKVLPFIVCFAYLFVVGDVICCERMLYSVVFCYAMFSLMSYVAKRVSLEKDYKMLEKSGFDSWWLENKEERVKSISKFSGYNFVKYLSKVFYIFLCLSVYTCFYYSRSLVNDMNLLYLAVLTLMFRVVEMSFKNAQLRVANTRLIEDFWGDEGVK